MAQQKVKIKIPKGIGPAKRRLVARDVIKFIQKRSRSGKSIYGRPFPKYSGSSKTKGKYTKSYASSKKFKSAGKSTRKITMQLSKEMLAKLSHLGDRSGSITVGYLSGDKNNDKAEGNQKGTYGSKFPVTKGRKFLGITQKALKEILRKHKG